MTTFFTWSIICIDRPIFFIIKCHLTRQKYTLLVSFVNIYSWIYFSIEEFGKFVRVVLCVVHIVYLKEFKIPGKIWLVVFWRRKNVVYFCAIRITQYISHVEKQPVDLKGANVPESPQLFVKVPQTCLVVQMLFLQKKWNLRPLEKLTNVKPGEKCTRESERSAAVQLWPQLTFKLIENSGYNSQNYLHSNIQISSSTFSNQHGWNIYSPAYYQMYTIFWNASLLWYLSI